MRFGINLRGDLAKLDDIEIASRYEKLLLEKEERFRRMPDFARYPAFRWLSPFMLGRGFFHAKFFYRIYAQLFRVAIALSAQDWVPDAVLDQYHSECEYKDVRDEIQRRLRWRKLSVARS